MVRLCESICTCALGEYRDRGFGAYEQDDHILALEHEHEVIALFPATSVTVEAVLKVCQQHLSEHHNDATVKEGEK